MSDSSWGLKDERLSGPSRRCTSAFAIMSVSVGLITAGCNDPRISIYEFLELQKSTSPVPTTQPSRGASEVWAKHAFLPYRVGPSDVLTVALTGVNDPTATTVVQARVDRRGEISLPMAGTVTVGGKELEDVEREIVEAFVPAFVKSLSVNVEVASYDTTEVLVVGAVATPGLLPLRRTECNILHTVAAAGGVSYDASGRISLRRVRRPTEEVTLDILDPLQLEAAFALDPLESGDIVMVEAAEPSVIYVVGLLNAPGPKLFSPGTKINLLQLLAASGGVISAVEPREATLIRRMPDGQDVRVKIDLKRLQNDESYPNILLAAGDVFEVPETFGTKTLAWMHQNLFFRAGVSVTGGVNASYNASGIDWLNRREFQKGRFGNQGGGTLQDQFDPLGFLGGP